jgi:hypothetical protein
MNRRVVFGVFVTLVAVAVLAAVGFYAYSWGLSQGALQNAQIVVPEGGEGVAPVYPYLRGPYHMGPWGWGWGWGGGFGFGFLRCLFPLLGLFLFFALLRGLFWRGRWGRGWGGPMGWDREHSTPPMFDEWHRRAHAGETGQTPPPTGQG